MAVTDLPKFLMERGGTWGGDHKAESPPPPPPLTPTPAYLGQTYDFGVVVVERKDSDAPSGSKKMYAIVHKAHGVVAVETGLLSIALKALEPLQAELDAATGRGVARN